MSAQLLKLCSWILFLFLCLDAVLCQSNMTCPDGHHFSQEHGQCIDTMNFIVNWIVLGIVLMMLTILLFLVGYMCYRWWPKTEIPNTFGPDSSQDKPQGKPLFHKTDGSTQSRSSNSVKVEKASPELAEEAIVSATEDQV